MATQGAIGHDVTAMEAPQTRARIAEVIPTIVVLGSLFLTQTVNGFYVGTAQPAPAAWPFLSSIAFAIGMLTWFRVYAWRYKVPWLIDMEWFVFLAWYILIPYYVLKREGRQGLSRIGLFCLTWLGAWATGVAIRIWVQVLTGD
jgi:hypothetical protein